jgi:hypothetical protein
MKDRPRATFLAPSIRCETGRGGLRTPLRHKSYYMSYRPSAGTRKQDPRHRVPAVSRLPHHPSDGPV